MVLVNVTGSMGDNNAPKVRIENRLQQWSDQRTLIRGVGVAAVLLCILRVVLVVCYPVAGLIIMAGIMLLTSFIALEACLAGILLSHHPPQVMIELCPVVPSWCHPCYWECAVSFLS